METDYYTHVELCSTGMHKLVQLTGAVSPGKILLCTIQTLPIDTIVHNMPKSLFCGQQRTNEAQLIFVTSKMHCL